MNTDDVIFKLVCAKWLNKFTGEVLYVGTGINIGNHNPHWVEIPQGAELATYSDNSVRSDVLLFWKDVNTQPKHFDRKSSKPDWVRSTGSLTQFLTEDTYKGKIIWALFK